MTYSYSGPMDLTPLLLSWNSSTVAVLSTSPGTLPSLMPLFWMSTSALTTVSSAPLSMLNPSTPSNISITTAVTPHQLNVPSLTPLPPVDVTSATIPMTSTLTPPTLLEPSLPGVTQSISCKNSYSSNVSSGKVSIFSPIHLPRTSLLNPPLSPSENSQPPPSHVDMSLNPHRLPTLQYTPMQDLSHSPSHQLYHQLLH